MRAVKPSQWRAIKIAARVYQLAMANSFSAISAGKAIRV
jgi:hypothetical protein